MKDQKDFKELVSNGASGVHDKIRYRRENRKWLKKSMQIALAVLKVLRDRNIPQAELAAKMEVTPQYISKILKGRENLTLDTIVKMEEVLLVNLIRVESYQYYAEYQIFTGDYLAGNATNRIELISGIQIEPRVFFSEIMDKEVEAPKAA